ncbi:unnamed protein product, partial [Meganyctiphanes norvegica]
MLKILSLIAHVLPSRYKQQHLVDSSVFSVLVRGPVYAALYIIPGLCVCAAKQSRHRPSSFFQMCRLSNKNPSKIPTLEITNLTHTCYFPSICRLQRHCESILQIPYEESEFCNIKGPCFGQWL